MLKYIKIAFSGLSMPVGRQKTGKRDLANSSCPTGSICPTRHMLRAGSFRTFHAESVEKRVVGFYVHVFIFRKVYDAYGMLSFG